MYAQTHIYMHIYFTACGPPKHQRVMSGAEPGVPDE